MIKSPHAPITKEKRAGLPLKNHAGKTVSFVLKALLKAFLVLAIFYYLYKKGLIDFGQLRLVLFRPEIALLGLSIFFLTNAAGAYRWKLLLKGQGINLSFWKAFELSMIGIFFNSTLPGAVSGDLMKGYLLIKGQSKNLEKSKALTTLLLDRILGVSALICVAFAAVLMNLGPILGSKSLRPMGGLVTLLFLGVAGFYFFVLGKWNFFLKIRRLLHKSPLGDRLISIYDALKTYDKSPRLMLEGFIVSLAIHCTLVGLFLALSRVLPGFEGVPLDAYFLVVPLGLLVTAVPIAPAGLGTGHAAFFGLFKLFHCFHGADIFSAYVSFQIISSLLGGFFYMRTSHGHPFQTFEALQPGA